MDTEFLDELLGLNELASYRRLIELAREMTATRMAHVLQTDFMSDELPELVAKRNALLGTINLIDATIADVFLSNGSIN